MKTINNKTIAQAFVLAAAAYGKTINEIVKTLPKAKQAKPAAEGSAMAGIAEKAVKAEKAPNYSEDVTAKLLSAWAAAGDKSTKEKSDAIVAKLAEQFGKTTRSIVAKLAREKVYTKPEYTTKTGEKPVSKEQHVTTIAAFIGCDAGKLESLEKANKNTLVTIEDALKKSAHDYDNATSDTPEVKAKKSESLSAIISYCGVDGEDLQSLMLASKEALSILANALAFGAGEDDEDQAIYDDLMAYAANDIGGDAQQAA